MPGSQRGPATPFAPTTTRVHDGDDVRKWHILKNFLQSPDNWLYFHPASFKAATESMMSNPILSVSLSRFLSPLLALSLFCSLLGPARGATDSELERQIEHYIKSLRGKGVLRGDERTAWLVYDFATGKKLVSINENTPLQAASMIKPYLALAYFHQVQAGKLSYGPQSKRHLELMIQKSNNNSTNWVMRQTGGPSATLALLKRNYPRLCQQIQLVEYIPSNGRTYRNRESAADYARFLFTLWKGDLPYSKEILRLMALPGNDRLYTKAKQVPSGTKVFNKTGSTAMCCGDRWGGWRGWRGPSGPAASRWC